MTLHRFEELCCQMLYEITGSYLSLSDQIDEDFDESDILSVVDRINFEYSIQLDTIGLRYKGGLGTILSKIYNLNQDLINLNI